MLVTRGYKVELDLNNEQRTACMKHTGAARWAYNYALRRKQAAYKAGQKTPYAVELQREIVRMKKDNPWMYEVSKSVFQEGTRHADAAYNNFFRKCKLKKQCKWKGKCGYPKYKSRKRGIRSATFNDGATIRVSLDTIKLPRLGTLRVKEPGYVPMNTKIVSATISEQAGHWYVSVCVRQEVPDPTKATGDVIGVDVGIKTLATTSDGRTFDNPKALRKKINVLKRTSRQHSRKQKGSNNRKKAKQKLVCIHRRIANVRKDALHKATSAIVARTKPDCERPSVIVLEDLNVSGMLNNHRLARACADVGFYEFKRQLLYKAAFAGVEVKLADRWYPSSKTCHCCGWVNEELTLANRVFVCEDCGLVTDRDYNAAMNLAALA